MQVGFRQVGNRGQQGEGHLRTNDRSSLQQAFGLGRESVDASRQHRLHGRRHLQAAEFLYETRLFPDREYTFKHALTHEVAYNSLLLERRRVLHGRVVETLEALAPERVAEQVERLAHHALRGEVWDKAVTYCQQAKSWGLHSTTSLARLSAR